MANSLSNLQRTAYEVFEETLAQGVADFAKCGPVYSTDEAKLTLNADQSGGGFTAYTAPGTSVDKDVTSGTVSFTSSPKAKIERFSWSQIKDNPELIQHRARSLANRAMADISAVWGTGVSATFTAAHPLAGTGAGQVGASKKFLDTSMGVSGLSQSNLFTAPLSRSALVGAIQTMREWKSWGADQVPLNLGADGSNLVLICGPENEDLAYSLQNSQLISADNQASMLGGRVAEVVVTPHTAVGSDWWLVDRSVGPIGMWIREMPRITVTEDSQQANLDVVMSARFHADFVYTVEGAGIIGSNVA